MLSSQQLSEAARAPWLATWRRVHEAMMAEAAAERLLMEASSEGRCALCGCRQLAACPGGCFWVVPGLCSSCVEAP